MKPAPRLTLAKERLAELANGDLAAVRGAAPKTFDCALFTDVLACAGATPGMCPPPDGR